ncbi:MAG: cytochrome c maturation protein CcmE [Candidatus Thioglobus sp.]|nr:cytochrome c maturation protein CcmE [Candidatus Thioglobus sp.]
MTKRQNRMILVGLLVSGVFLAGYLGIKAFSENLLYFYTPSDIVDGKAPANKNFRVGGLVETDSLVREGMLVTFMVTDNIKSIKVTYEGILPDLFREGQGVVASGTVLNKCVGLTCTNTFIASEVLAKHDENYMPPEVAAALEASSQE